MRKNYPFLIAILILWSANLLWAQNNTNVEALNELAIEFNQEWNAGLERAVSYAKQHNIPVRQELPGGQVVQLIDVQDGIPVYRTTSNYGAALTTRTDRLWEDGSSGLELSGEGYDRLGEWDAGIIRTSHQEFTDQDESRVNNMNGGSTHQHSTHVAGTMIAAGVNSNAHGMAYAAELNAYDWNNDNNEMAQAAADGMEISNHSYNIITGWWWNGGWEWSGNPNVDPNEDYRFGFYTNNSRNLDLVARNAPYYLISWAAGNNRGEGPGGSGPERDGGADGYDCIPSEPIAKNIMTVGAVNQVSSYSGPEDVVMSSFSGWGPADDGRIKPDIVGKGVSVFSTANGSDSDYTSMSGTSMATPNVAGSMALLQYHYQNLFGSPMLAATLKGLVIHTADEAGPEEGPDYKFGWGLMNAYRAAEVITKDTLQKLIDELTLEEGETYTREVTVAEDSILRVTICWTDPPGTPVAPSLNPRDPSLVNDLDLTIKNSANITYYPYKLDPDSPSDPATKNSKNAVDNVEMVFIPETPAGTYTIQVSHDGELEDGEQAFSLIVTGISDLPEPLCVENLTAPAHGDTNLLLNQFISWEAATYADSYDVYFGTDGGGEETPTNVFNGENFTDTGFDYLLDPDTTYYIQIVPRNQQGTAAGCDQIWSFSTMEAVETYPFNEQFADVEPPEIPFGYQTIDNSDGMWISNGLSGHFDEYSLICLNPEGLVETDFDNWLISLPFSVKGGEDYDVSFFYKNAVPGTNESMSVYFSQTPYLDDMTNLVYRDNSFDDNNWLEGNGVMTPENDGVAFLGIYVKSNDGYGVYLDDITIDGWTVGIENDQLLPETQIVSNYGRLTVNSTEDWSGSVLRVTNMMGQVVYSGTYRPGYQLNLSGKGIQGIVVVTLANEDKQYTQKVLVR